MAPRLLTFDDVAAALGLGGEHEIWRDRFPESEGFARREALDLPSAEDLPALCEQLRFPDDVGEALVPARRALDDEPALVRLLHHCRWLMRSADPDQTPFATPWPQLPDEVGDGAALFYPMVLLAEAPRLRRWHADKGISEEVSLETIADVGRQIDICRCIYGRWAFDEMAWLGHHFAGRLFQLGRLQFAFGLWWIPLAAGEECDLEPMAPVLDVHIPDIGPLDPDDCDRSFALARRFFAEHFPSFDYRAFMCFSWLLDDQLGDYLAADTNIMRFQRRWRLVQPERPTPDRAGVLRLVFRRIDPDLDDLPQGTTLQRTIVGHLRAGREWETGLGYIPA